VQNVIQLEGGRAALKLTTASYWRPSGKNIHRLKGAPEEAEWGVRPDAGLEVKLTEEEADAIRQGRRQKDIGAKPDNAKTQPQGEQQTAKPPPDDPQLRKAVEYLQQQF